MQVCSDACRTAVETIASARLDAWYDLRTHSDAQGATTADPRHLAELEAWRVPEVEASLLRPAGDSGTDDGHDTGTSPDGGSRTASSPTAVTLTVEGMRCAGCAWLVERLLASTPGVSTATVDFPLRRAEVRFDTRSTRLHTLLETLARAGYRATPYTVHAEEAAIEAERRARIRGLGISALFGMQVMLLSIALYASEWYGGMEAGFEQLFRWLAMMLTVPVLAWPGRAFFTGAVAALRNRHLTMDVPVALGLSIAFAGSAFATVTGEGEVWFDSVVMFVTLLSAARYLELLARRRATATIRALARSAPLVATRVRESRTSGDAGGDRDRGRDRGRDARAGTRAGKQPRSGGQAGDDADCGDGSPRRRGHRTDTGRRAPPRRPGAGPSRRGGARRRRHPLRTLRVRRVPAHRGVESGRALGKATRVLAGSVNGAGVVEVEVTGAGDETVLGGVLRRAERAARERPAIAQLADRAAAWFIGAVLVLATGVAIGWLLHDPSRMIPVLVSVLVVTCPCALSLATPAAMTAALGALARAGLIATRANAVERLALATHCLADKTGTLTEGRFRLQSVTAFTDVSEPRCLALAAALERYATHPAAAALVAAADAVGTEPAKSGSRTQDLAAKPVIEDMMRPKLEAKSALSGHADAAEAVAVQSANRVAPEVDVDPGTHTGGVTGRIDGVRYAVGSVTRIRRPCLRSGPEFDTRNQRRGQRDIRQPRKTASPEAAEAVACNDGAGAPADPDQASPDRVFPLPPGTTTAPPTSSSPATAPSSPASSSPTPFAPTPRRSSRACAGAASTPPSPPATLPPRSSERPASSAIAHHLAGLSPEDKLDEAARLAASGERVLMLGDGVNDTPALAGAHVSVAMGRGAAAAAARADAVLIGDDPGRLLAALDIARHARRIVKQNLAWALGYNLVALPLAAAGAVPPWAAAIGMSLSSLAVAANALRLGRTPVRTER